MKYSVTVSLWHSFINLWSSGIHVEFLAFIEIFPELLVDLFLYPPCA